MSTAAEEQTVLALPGRKAVSPEPELLDLEGLPLEETERSLRDLKRFNRFLFGSASVVRVLLPKLGNRPRQRLLDVGTGTGDLPASLARAARARGVELSVVGVDRKLSHLLLGRRLGVSQHRVVASALELPFRKGAFEWSLCTLLLHHFDSPGKRLLLREMRRTSSREAVIVDLRRSPWTRWLVRLLLPLLGASKTTRHDGRVSAQRSSSLAEVAALFEDEPVRELQPRFPCRYSMVVPAE